MTKIVVTGADGQLGQCLRASLPQTAKADFFSRAKFDLTQPDYMYQVLKASNAEFVVNCAAYTNVDGAESDPENAGIVNAIGVRQLAEICKELSIQLIHVSTDFVFSGEATTPYLVDAPCDPLGVYGKTKRQGEEAVLEILPDHSMIIRTSWLYSEFGENFVKTILRLMDSLEQFTVVRDQQGSPTYARGLAELIWHVTTAKRFQPGIYHWSDGGVTTWFDFAQEVGRGAEAQNLLDNPGKVLPITAKEYGSKAPRPNYSVLDCESTAAALEWRQQSWQSQLSKMLDYLSNTTNGSNGGESV